MYAIESMRLEKSYLSWKGDITTEFSPTEAGLSRFISLQRPDFMGRAALLERDALPYRHRFVTMVLGDTDAESPYGSLILKDSAIIGFVTSGGYGHRTGQSIALGYELKEHDAPGNGLDISIFGSARHATIMAGALYDPENLRLKN